VKPTNASFFSNLHALAPSGAPELLQLLNFSETARSARVASFFSNLHAPCPWGAPEQLVVEALKGQIDYWNEFWEEDEEIDDADSWKRTPNGIVSPLPMFKGVASS
jgi:hypothetical protein